MPKETEITPKIAADAVAGEDTRDFQMTAVDSSTIAQLGYHPESQTARVAFKNKKTGAVTGVYDYSNVSPEVFEKWRMADSIGSFHHSEIKSNPEAFPYRKVS